jgi:hypothetical protein
MGRFFAPHYSCGGGMKKHILYAAGLFPVLVVLGLFSCSTEDAIERVLGSGGQPPVFLGCKAVAQDEIVFKFSLPVRAVSVKFDPEMEVAGVKDGSVVTVHLGKNPGAGERVLADILVEDEKGNTLNVLVPFRTRNDRLPPLVITELRTEYSKPKAEFIEFKTLKEGNLGALRVFIAGNSKKPLVYEFSPVETGGGEYILLHLRTMEEGAADETGSDLDLSGGTDAVAGIRDFWVPGADKLLRKTDAVYFMDQDDRIIDAALMSEKTDSWWAKEHFAQAAELLGSQGAWQTEGGKTPGPEDAVITAAVKTAMTRSVSRREGAPDTNTAADWYVTSTGGISPGKPNKP